MAKRKTVKTVKKVFKLTRYSNGQHFRTDLEFDSVYNGDTRYSRLSFDGGLLGHVQRLLETAGKSAPLGSKVRVTIEVG